MTQERYTPGEEEVKKAAEMMSDPEAKLTALREALVKEYGDIVTKIDFGETFLFFQPGTPGKDTMRGIEFQATIDGHRVRLSLQEVFANDTIRPLKGTIDGLDLTLQEVEDLYTKYEDAVKGINEIKSAHSELWDEAENIRELDKRLDTEREIGEAQEGARATIVKELLEL